MTALADVRLVCLAPDAVVPPANGSAARTVGLAAAVRPVIAARASGTHHGAPIPASAGRTLTPPESSTVRASSVSAGGSGARPSSPLNHSSSAPAVKTPPSSA